MRYARIFEDGHKVVVILNLINIKNNPLTILAIKKNEMNMGNSQSVDKILKILLGLSNFIIKFLFRY